MTERSETFRSWGTDEDDSMLMGEWDVTNHEITIDMLDAEDVMDRIVEKLEVFERENHAKPEYLVLGRDAYVHFRAMSEMRSGLGVSAGADFPETVLGVDIVVFPGYGIHPVGDAEFETHQYVLEEGDPV